MREMLRQGITSKGYLTMEGTRGFIFRAGDLTLVVLEEAAHPKIDDFDYAEFRLKLGSTFEIANLSVPVEPGVYAVQVRAYRNLALVEVILVKRHSMEAKCILVP